MTATPPPQRIAAGTPWPLFGTQATRAIEQRALQAAADHTLMQRAGQAVARLVLALAPHAQVVWIAAGPGNNGGDGLEAAVQLQRWGKHAVVTWLGSPTKASQDSLASWKHAVDAGVTFADTPPQQFDVAIDALLGIGATRAPQGRLAELVVHLQKTSAPVLAVDIPTGLDPDTGQAASCCVHASATLCLLTLKPGLFTADGRDAAGQVWLDALGVDIGPAWPEAPIARLAGAPLQRTLAHASHKGSRGDVAILGGAPGMAGAAWLAGSAALHAGAGRVYVGLLGTPAAAPGFQQAELMLRQADQMDLSRMVVVCGCGGGDAVHALLPRVLSTASRLVLDADALNAVGRDTQLQQQLRARGARGRPTVLTPHPLEAARLLATTSADVQANRIGTAQRLAETFQCTTVLKGSGSIIAAPGQGAVINTTGNARLATAGTGDVLAGAIGAALAAGLPEFRAAQEAVFLHGQCADHWPAHQALTASELARALRPHAAAPTS